MFANPAKSTGESGRQVEWSGLSLVNRDGNSLEQQQLFYGPLLHLHVPGPWLLLCRVRPQLFYLEQVMQPLPELPYMTRSVRLDRWATRLWVLVLILVPALVLLGQVV